MPDDQLPRQPDLSAPDLWGSADPARTGLAESGPAPPGPDPATVSGPPWPALIAPPGYRPPPLIRWPMFTGVAALAAYVVVLVSGAFVQPAPSGQATWLVSHDSTILKLNRDQSALQADNPTTGGPSAQWLRDWATFHDDAVAAAALPNPGGTATAPWREMLNNYVNGSSELVQAVATRNPGELNQAQRDLAAGDQAAREFNQALGISRP